MSFSTTGIINCLGVCVCPVVTSRTYIDIIISFSFLSNSLSRVPVSHKKNEYWDNQIYYYKIDYRIYDYILHKYHSSSPRSKLKVAAL